MNDSPLDKKQRHCTHFSPKKDFWKMKMDMTLPIIFVITPVDGLCYKVANSSIQQEFFSSVQNCSIIQCKKTLRVDKTRQKLRDKTTKKWMKITNKEWMKEWKNLKNEYRYTYDMLCCVMRLTRNQKAQQTQYYSMAILFEKTVLCYSLLHDFQM